MKKVLSVVGTRPNYIKLAALDKSLRQYFRHVIVDTGQHYDYNLSKQFFAEFKLPKPKFTLGVKNESPHLQIANMISLIGPVLEKERPELVIVYGDTNSTLSGAISSVKLKIPTLHIEAGIRSGDPSSPEEQNRKMIDSVSTYLLCPTKIGLENLKKENLCGFFVGDIMLDLYNSVPHKSPKLDNTKVSKQYYLCTIHRQENTQDEKKLKWFLDQLSQLDHDVIFPIHPRTKNALSKINVKSRNINFIAPIPYSQSINLTRNALAVITDSGGIQKEAYFAKVPCITLREKTEWPETLNYGWNKLINYPYGNLAKEIKIAKSTAKHPEFFGHGNATVNTIKFIRKVLDS